MVFRGLVEEHDHPLARHHVSAARRICVLLVCQVAINGWRDVDRPRLYPELVDDELGVSERVGIRRAIGHAERDYVLRPECLCGQESGNRRIDSARETDDCFLEGASLDFFAQKRNEPAVCELRVYLEGWWTSGRGWRAHDGNGLASVVAVVRPGACARSLCRMGFGRTSSILRT